jgi:hypothetical protein
MGTGRPQVERKVAEVAARVKERTENATVL